MAKLSKTYDPKQVEDKWYAHWEAEGYFHPEASEGGEPYCIVIPPPNVTGILHMGHALNNTIQDVLVRWQRMKGKNSVWVPGTDHAGIATQSVVERNLAKEGKTRHDLGREKFLERVWEWREQYGNTITSQLRKLGASCDWQRERFTLDDGLSDAVTEVFVRLYEKGLIYRGQYIINWSPQAHTALADEEVEYKDLNGKLYHLKYPVGDDGKEFIVVATTRPETMLGDTAVAINPRDERYSHLADKKVTLPIMNRELRVIKDDYVDPEFGTGVVKVTPAHDPNDFDMGIRHDLERINVMNGDASMNENAGPYSGMDRFECRKKIVEDLEKMGLIEKIEDYKHSVGHCYRTGCVIEPRLSEQWFVKMKPLAREAVKVVKEGDVRFVPDRWTKVYLEWMENIRDWCISRQIWWGHRIPVFYCDQCNHEWAAKGQPANCPECGSDKVRQDEDVLDTWFSSWLWPFSVFGWPKKTDDLKFYYPTHSLVTASEIIFFWVARMIMSGLEFMGEIPFRDIYIHGTVRDDNGLKMSKSLGNSIDPLDIIEEFSADALRFSLMMLTATGQDVYISSEKFEVGRNFATKIWNAARFMQMQSEDIPTDFDDPQFDADLMTPDDIHILAKLHSSIAQAEENLERFRFNDVAKTLYEFVWHNFCDWYVEVAKQTLYGDDEGRRANVLKIMHYAFSTSIKLLHPLMPFVTEELWHEMGYSVKGETIMKAPWPSSKSLDELKAWGIEKRIVNYVDAKHDMIRTARTLMADYGLLPKNEIEFIVTATDEKTAEILRGDISSVKGLLRAANIEVRAAGDEPEGAVPSALSQLGTVFMPIEGKVDVGAEIDKLSGQLSGAEGHLERVNRKLENMDFISKAPKHVVAVQENRKKELLEQIDKLQKLISTMKKSQ